MLLKQQKARVLWFETGLFRGFSDKTSFDSSSIPRQNATLGHSVTIRRRSSDAPRVVRQHALGPAGTPVIAEEAFDQMEYLPGRTFDAVPTIEIEPLAPRPRQFASVA